MLGIEEKKSKSLKFTSYDSIECPAFLVNYMTWHILSLLLVYDYLLEAPVRMRKTHELA